MFAWIPIIGPIIQGIVSLFGKWQDTKLATYQTDADVAKTAITISAQTLSVFKDDLGVQICRDLILFPTAIWYSFIVWDTLVVKTHPQWMLHPEALPASVAYVPGMVLIFLFGINTMNIWKAFK